MLVAALLTAVSLAGTTPEEDPWSRLQPVPRVEMTVAHGSLRPAQGGQRVRVTIPMTAGVTALGDEISYRWDVGSDGGERCEPGALPTLAGVTAGTVIDAPLPQPARGWCRGSYSVTLEAVVHVNCDRDPPPYCRAHPTHVQEVGDAAFQVGSPPEPVCHRRGDVEWCWTPATYRDPARWSVLGLLDDLLGPDGATMDADPYLRRAFRSYPKLDEWETDDDYFYGWPPNRVQALAMVAVLHRALRAGPYHGRRWPGRMTLDRYHRLGGR